MIKKGEYKVKGVMSISKSLATQKSLNNDPKVGDIHKGVVERRGDRFVVYFLDNIDFGKDSVIHIPKDKLEPLLYKDDYTIVEKVGFRINKKFISHLLSKNDLVK